MHICLSVVYLHIIKNIDIMKISALKNKINNIQAKKWGYKNTKEALADGMYGVLHVSITLTNLKDLLKISESDAMDLVYKWRDNGEVTYSGVCGLQEIYFSNK